MKHYLKQSVKLMGFLVLVYGLAACSAKIEGGEAPTPPPRDRFEGKARIQGPAVEGQWSSNCIYYSTKSSRMISFSFVGQNVTRTSEMFSDGYCQKSQKKDTQVGQFIFSKSYKDGRYEISYAFDAGAGWILYTEENLVLENGELYVSDFRTGEYGDVNQDLRMFKKAVTP